MAMEKYYPAKAARPFGFASLVKRQNVLAMSMETSDGLFGEYKELVAYYDKESMMIGFAPAGANEVPTNRITTCKRPKTPYQMISIRGILSRMGVTLGKTTTVQLANCNGLIVLTIPEDCIA